LEIGGCSLENSWDLQTEDERSRSLQGFLKRCISTPNQLMLWTWVLYSFFCMVVPIHYHRSISWTTYSFVGCCLVMFFAGSRIAQGRAGTPFPCNRVVEVHDENVVNGHEGSIRLFAYLGVLGAICVLVDKLVISGLDLSQGLGALRLNLNYEFDQHKERSAFLWIGTLLYSFSNVSVLLYILEGEGCSRLTGVQVVVASFTSLIVILVYGGRSLEFLFLILVASSCMVRSVIGKRMIPRVPYFRSMMAIHLTILVALTFYVFSARSAAHLDSSISNTLQRFENDLNAEFPTALISAMESPGPAGELLGNSMMLLAYLSSPMAELDYLLTENSAAGPFWGRSQLWPIDKVVRIIEGPLVMSVSVEESIHHSGVFFTVWGGMYVDFGFWFSPLIVGVLGFLSGAALRGAVEGGSVNACMMLAFSYLCILVAPIHSPFAAGNTLQVLLCLVAACFILRWKELRKRREMAEDVA
jgi:hypothetical protein